MEKTFKNQKQNTLKNNKHHIRENYRNTEEGGLRNTEEGGLSNSREDRSTWEGSDNLSSHTLQAGFYQEKEFFEKEVSMEG